MDAGLIVAVGLALAFAVTNGMHDASNAIATLVATRAARPGPAIALASVCNRASSGSGVEWDSGAVDLGSTGRP